MNEVGFRRGSQATIDKIIEGGAAVAGAFYLSSDKHRLYIGNADNTLSPVNQGVVTIASVFDLPGQRNNPFGVKIPGEFYYVLEGNILCTYNGTTWVQINNNTDTTYELIAAAIDNGVELKIDDSSSVKIVEGENISISKTTDGLNIAVKGVYTSEQIDNILENLTLKHTLTIGDVVYDGSEDKEVPVYKGTMEID